MTRRPADFVFGLLTQSLGASVAKARVLSAVRQIGLSESSLSQQDAEMILEILAQEKGLVGSAARFAKVRLALCWDQVA